MKKRIAWILPLAGVASLALLACSTRPPETGRSARDAQDVAESVDDRGDEFRAGPQSARSDGRPSISEVPQEQIEIVARELRDVFFGFDRAELTLEARETLSANARILREHSRVQVFIEGHCDERGTNEYNLALGERRARSVRDYLVQSGIAADRLYPVSYGEERPFAMGHDEATWAQNRRGHFRVRTQY